VGFRQVLVIGAIALAQIGDGVETETIDAGIEPALHHLRERADHARIVEIEIRLMREEAVPVELAGFRVPCQFDFSVSVKIIRVPAIFLVGVAPHIPVAARSSQDRCGGRA